MDLKWSFLKVISNHFRDDFDGFGPLKHGRLLVKHNETSPLPAKLLDAQAKAGLGRLFKGWRSGGDSKRRQRRRGSER